MGGGDVKIVPGSELKIVDGSEITVKGTPDHPFKIDKVTGVERLRMEPLRIKTPIAAHIKEVNHIDPLSIEALNVSEVRNIEPLKIEKFNVTNLPMVNMSLRQLPQVDMNIKKIPPLSIGSHQDFHVPSNYTVSGRILGIEFFRVHLDGHTRILPKERYRREQEMAPEKSFPVPAAGGNPAIPSLCGEVKTHVSYPPSMCGPRGKAVGCSGGGKTASGMGGRPAYHGARKGASISFGMPDMSFHIDGPDNSSRWKDHVSSTVSSGE